MSSSSTASLDTIPQKGAMRLLESIRTHNERETCCTAAVADSHLFTSADGSVPAWVALEYMAQCSAVHGALASPGSNESSGKIGVLAGCRRLELRCDSFDPTQRLEIRARPAGRLGAALAFDCDVRRDGAEEVLAMGRLQVSLVSPSEFYRGDTR